MTGSTFITFRNDPDVEITYTYSEDWDHGDCAGVEVEWSFSDPTMHALFTVTPEEDDAITKRIVKVAGDRYWGDGD